MKISSRNHLFGTAVIMAAAQLSTAVLATPLVDSAHAHPGVSTINTAGLTTTVKQTADTAKIHWKTIDTNGNEVLTFVQPNANSVALNYITGGSPTDFAGTLNANGKVAVINPYGVTFAGGSQVNVSALMATTAKRVALHSNDQNNDCEDTSWDVYKNVPTGDYTIGGITDSSVNFNGKVTTKNSYVLGLAKNITVGTNAVINSGAGNIGLYTGSKSYLVDLHGKGGTYQSHGQFTSSSLNANGKLLSDGGTIGLTSRASIIANATLNLNGVVDSSNLTGNGGRVRVISSGDANIGGTVNVSAAAPKGTTNRAYIYASAGKDLNVNANLLNASTKGSNYISLNAKGNANLKGTFEATGNTASAVRITSGKNTNLGAGVQVGNGKATIISKGTTTIDKAGYIDAQGNHPGALPSLAPSNNGGTITIASKGDVVMNGYVDSGSLQGKAGNVKITSSTGNISSNSKIAGNRVIVSAKKNITFTDEGDYVTAYNGGYPTGPGTGGNIKLNSGGDITISTLLSSGNINSGGNITATAKGNVDVNAPIVTSSSKGKAGNVDINGETVTKTSQGSYDVSGANGNGKVTVNGIVQ